MTVQELCELFVDDELQTINLWSHDKEDVIWTGKADEVYNTEYADMEVSSIDNLESNSNVLTINLLDDIKEE